MSTEPDDYGTDADETTVATLSEPKSKTAATTATRRQPPYNVIVLNDDDHTFEYVIEMLAKLFGHSVSQGKRHATEIHLKGRSIVYTTHKEKAELKCEQVLAYGPDPRLPRSKSSLGCYIEPAPAE
jgi:ATP-dependent Clp protease adaptor protein ClpS